MKKILIISPMALENGRGGEISSMELAVGLNKYYNVILMDTDIVTGKKLLTRKVIKQKLNKIEYRGKIKFACFHLLGRTFSLPFPQDVVKLLRISKDKDVLYYSISNFTQSLVFMFLLLINSNLKFIIGYRKPLYSNKLLSLYNLKYRLTILLLSMFKKRVYHHALSRNTEIFLNSFYNPNKVIHVIHGIDLKNYDDFLIKTHNRTLLKFSYIGYLDDVHKGIAVLLKAIEKILIEHSDLKMHFEFCGMGPLESELKGLENKFPTKIKFYGYVSNEDIPIYYKQSDAFLFSSRVEPFPRSIMEALAASLIILCSKTIGSIELLKGKEFAFFFKELTPNAIAEEILKIYALWETDPKYFYELKAKANRYIRENYSLEKEILMFKQLIDKITT